MLSPHSIDAIPPQYWIASAVLTLSPHMYWCYPSTVLNSLHNTDATLHSTEQPPQYWTAPTVLNSLHSTDATLHSTDAIPHMYWCYPPQYCSYPPQYWIASTVLTLSSHMYCSYPPQYWTASTVLMLFLCSTDAIPPQYWCYPPAVLMLFPRSTDAIPHSTEQPPQYWCYPPHVLNSLRSTEPTLYGVMIFAVLALVFI